MSCKHAGMNLLCVLQIEKINFESKKDVYCQIFY